MVSHNRKPPSEPGHPGAAQRVLVVDDNKDGADTLAMVLKTMGADPRVVYDGHSALAAIREHRPALVLLDLGMPGMDGYEVAARIRADAASRGVRLIALTGFGSPEEQQRCREAGFDDHCIKPVDPARLRVLLAAAADGRPGFDIWSRFFHPPRPTRLRIRTMPRSFFPGASFGMALAALVLGGSLGAQARPAAATAAPMLYASSDPLLAPFRFRSIGPASMGGRIDDIAVSESDPNIIYLGYAVGGVFKSENNGTTFEPVFQGYGTASIGDIAIHPRNPNIVYVGTGEANNRQTASFGDGIYKTTDGGKTFTNIGLRETQTIARIVIDPRNPEIVYVASPGHLFGPNPDRGVYKTTDGGKTWNKVKFIDDDTGFNDIAIDPSNSNVLYAASYQRRRTGCCFNGGGPGSALWKSTLGGAGPS